MKRTLDVCVALAGLVLLAPLLALVGLLVKVSSAGPVLFRQERIGRHFRPFWMYKFRSMVAKAPAQGGLLTVQGDRRVTAIGRILRKTKLDELPQLLNVLRGDMSLVGPRPEVRKYVDMFRADYEELLTVRPGLTDPASLRYRDESAILAQVRDPEGEYVGRILPDKLRLSKEYVRNAWVGSDLALLLRTFGCVLGFRAAT